MINWAYVAGFTDGEGTIRQNYVRLYQKHPEVLERIEEFLRSEGIECHVRCRKTPRITNFLVINQESYLQITKRAFIGMFLSKTIPYLIVKEPIARDVLRYYALFPQRSNREVGMLGRERSSSKYGRGLHDKIVRSRGRFAIAQ